MSELRTSVQIKLPPKPALRPYWRVWLQWLYFKTLAVLTPEWLFPFKAFLYAGHAYSFRVELRNIRIRATKPEQWPDVRLDDKEDIHFD